MYTNEENKHMIKLKLSFEFNQLRFGQQIWNYVGIIRYHDTNFSLSLTLPRSVSFSFTFSPLSVGHNLKVNRNDELKASVYERRHNTIRLPYYLTIKPSKGAGILEKSKEIQERLTQSPHAPRQEWIISTQIKIEDNIRVFLLWEVVDLFVHHTKPGGREQGTGVPRWLLLGIEKRHPGTNRTQVWSRNV